jgi:hypothetical protein
MNRIENVTKPLLWFSALLLTAVAAGCGGQDPILGGSGGTYANANPAGNLGILATYGIASYGGITNTNSGGTTQINGDVVLNPNYTCNAAAVGSTNDLSACVAPNTPLNNVGDKVVTPIFPDTTTAPAVTAALNTKWNSLSPASLPGATVLGCGTIGDAGGAGTGIGCAGNATLPAGVYISQTSSTIGITGTLTLNGSASDVWVFQAPSALTANVGGTILLTGGAKASNVWWYVGSSATLGTNAIFNGNIMASASISMQNLATSCGRLLAGAGGSGAFALDTNTVSVPGHPNAPPGCQ